MSICNCVWLCVFSIMHDYAFVCLTLYSYIWLCMTMYDYVSLCMAICDFLLIFLTFYDTVWLRMILNNPYNTVWQLIMFDSVWLWLTVFDSVWLWIILLQSVLVALPLFCFGLLCLTLLILHIWLCFDFCMILIVQFYFTLFEFAWIYF